MGPARVINLSQKCLVLLGSEVLVELPAQGGDHFGFSGLSADYSNALSPWAQQKRPQSGRSCAVEGSHADIGLKRLREEFSNRFLPLRFHQKLPIAHDLLV